MRTAISMAVIHSFCSRSSLALIKRGVRGPVRRAFSVKERVSVTLSSSLRSDAAQRWASADWVCADVSAR